MLERLVSFDTTSRHCNLEMISFIEEYLQSHDIRSQRFDHVPGCKTNLFATIGPAIGGIALSGHTDVVPVDGQPWSTDPFRLTARGNRLYGRGACDMKGFIAAALSLIPQFKAQPLLTPIHLAFSCDEEIGCRGVKPMLEGIRTAGPLPRVAIVGEPTSMRMIDAHKGSVTLVTEVTGAEAHSSDPMRGVNAITFAARLIGDLESQAAKLRSRKNNSGRFSPPYSTLHVGLVSGGTVKNVVPRTCKITWEVRPLPGTNDMSEVRQQLAEAEHRLELEMQAMAPGAGIKTTVINEVPGLEPMVESPVKRAILHLARSSETATASFATEAGLFQAAGVPALVCGPGNIEQAHRADEFIEREQLDRCVRFMMDLSDYCASEALPPA